jgi:voltage-gated potassium channel
MSTKVGVRLRERAHEQLFSEAWDRGGLSPTNWAIVVAIFLATATSVLETEPTLVADPTLAVAFNVLDSLFGVIFVAEYLIRLWAAGESPGYSGILGRIRYAITPVALLDLLAIAPVIVTLGVSDAFVLRLFRVMRIILLTRLGAFFEAARLLQEAIQSRRHELLLSAMVAGFVLLFSATALFMVESETQPESFGSIPRALWWAVGTLTTVGYGDVYPVTVLGRILAGMSALAAIGVIAMPTGILAAGFSEAFQRSRDQRLRATAATKAP